MKSLSEQLQRAWRAGLSPIINGIVYANGQCILLPPIADLVENASISPTKSVDLSEFRHPFDETTCARISETYEVVDYRRFLKVGCGETSYDGEGFVALSHPKTGDLIWIALLAGAGVFKSCSLSESHVIATTESNFKWYFRIDSPEVIVISTME